MACNGLRYIAGAPAVSGVLARSLLGGNVASQLNRFIGDAALYKGSGTPSGYSPMYAWYPNRQSGGMGSRYQVIGAAGTGTSKLYAGRSMPVRITAQATLTATGIRIFVENMLSELIGEGTLNPTGTLLAGAVCLLGIIGEGTLDAELIGRLDAAMVDIGGSSDVVSALGAIGGMVADIIASATTEATPFAIGSMETSIMSYSTLSPENMAAAVWNAIAADFNKTGTTGKTLSSAGSAGDPWDTNMAAYTDDATFGAFMKKLLTTGKYLGLK